MKQALGLNGIVLGGAAVLMAVQPAWADPVQVTGVQVSPTANGMDVRLQTQSGANPQVFAVNRGDRWTADITNSQLRLPNSGSSFSQTNPAPGISQVTVVPLDANNVRVTVIGKNTSPTGQVNRPEQGGLVLSINPAALKPGATPIAVPAPDNTLAQAQVPSPIVPPNRSPGPPLPQGAPTPLVPNPNVTIQGGVPGVPPNLPRAYPPPVGDNASSQTSTAPSMINLGTSERIPRLVLRDAPAREVLSLLARAAGLNIAYIDAASGLPGQQQQQAAQPGAAANEGPRITLDVENESVQDVFNNVLRISGLEANREGRTIFISTRLPNSARNVVVRSVRLNQVPVTNAVLYLVTLGAESAVTRERQVTSVSAVPVGQLAGGGTGSAITQSQTTTESRIENQRVNYVDSVPILRGVLANGDERTNTITLTGDPRKVEIALTQLTQLDLRRRQVVVNVRVIDVNLLALDRLAASFSFGVGRTQVVNSDGVALLNFGSSTPGNNGGSFGTTFPSVFGSPVTPTNGFSTNGFSKAFFLQLQAAVTNGNAKILTDPTLVVQEGQTASVNLTQEVLSNFIQTTTFGTNGIGTTTVTIEKARAGLILGVKVDRIDDNGFVGLSVAPSVSQPNGSVSAGQIFGNTSITLLAERRLESGQIRLRDGQTLVLSGIIQEQDRTSISKVPILGDIPLLGALFRRTERENQRREVIVLVTPRILDDSDRSTFGYSYTPTPETQQFINQTNDRPRQN